MKAYRLAHEFALARQTHPLIFSARQGRWNSEGLSMTYMSEHPALAALEMLGYWDVYASLRGYQLLMADFPDSTVEDAGHLDPADEQAARAFGDAWLTQGRSLVLRVRSVTVPASYNLLLNSSHPDFSQLAYTHLGPFDYDTRVHQLIQAAQQK